MSKTLKAVFDHHWSRLTKDIIGGTIYKAVFASWIEHGCPPDIEDFIRRCLNEIVQGDE